MHPMFSNFSLPSLSFIIPDIIFFYIEGEKILLQVKISTLVTEVPHSIKKWIHWIKKWIRSVLVVATDSWFWSFFENSFLGTTKGPSYLHRPKHHLPNRRILTLTNCRNWFISDFIHKTCFRENAAGCKVQNNSFTQSQHSHASRIPAFAPYTKPPLHNTQARKPAQTSLIKKTGLTRVFVWFYIPTSQVIL